MDLQGKSAVVTGGAIRIGRGIVLALAEAGCNILLHYGRSALEAERTANEARKFGVDVALVSADLSDPSAPEKIIQAGIAQFGQIDILINNAAIIDHADSFRDTSSAEWDRMMGINSKSPYFLSQAFAKQLGDSQGKIIMINDGRIETPDIDFFLYRLSKQLLWTMVPMLAKELAPNITVNGLALGAMLPFAGSSQAEFDAYAKENLLLQRTGSAEIVAENVLHLLSQDFITGGHVKIDGGEFL